MIKKSITYSDLDGNKVTEEFYFHFSKAELMELAVEGEQGGLEAQMRELINSKDQKGILAAFKMFVQATVGRRSEDGKRFIKNDEIKNEFMQSDAYSTLLFDLMTNPKDAAAFMTGVVPSDMTEMINAEFKKNDVFKDLGPIEIPLAEFEAKQPNQVTPVKKYQDYTMEELVAMPPAMFQSLSMEYNTELKAKLDAKGE